MTNPEYFRGVQGVAVRNLFELNCCNDITNLTIHLKFQNVMLVDGYNLEKNVSELSTRVILNTLNGRKLVVWVHDKRTWFIAKCEGTTVLSRLIIWCPPFYFRYMYVPILYWKDRKYTVHLAMSLQLCEASTPTVDAEETHIAPRAKEEPQLTTYIAPSAREEPSDQIIQGNIGKKYTKWSNLSSTQPPAPGCSSVK